VTYFLDTNICVYFLKGMFSPLRARLLAHRPAEIAIASLVKAELLFGAYTSERRVENEEAVSQFLLPFGVVPFGDSEAIAYAEIRARLKAEGTPIGPNDMIIAATALANDGVLVTHNTSEFGRVQGLAIEDWTLDRN
jgi:tRNA(fMet)-specific endonuclease VapC